METSPPPEPPDPDAASGAPNAEAARDPALAAALGAALGAARARIAETDRALLHLVARRAALAREAAAAKGALGRALVDPAQEVEVERRMRAHAADLGLPPAEAGAVARALIALARAAQGA